ncbi:hypothetical protein ABBQ32_007800 [Trebouxia sp. C0010 RCD-2024]
MTSTDWISSQQHKAKSAAKLPTAHKELITKSSGLSLYQTPPSSIISIEDFERYAIDRLRVLKGIEEHKAKGCNPKEVQDKAKQLADEHLKVRSSEQSAFKDQVSHFVLRLAYCRTEDLRRWFLAQESELFRARFCAETASQRLAFMVEAGLEYDQCTPEELNAKVQPSGKPLWELLAQVEESKWNRELAIDTRTNPALRIFFKVDFEAVPDLVAGRKVFLRHGQAYVSKTDVVSLVVGHFRSHLSQALVETARKWASHIAAEESERLTPVIEALSTRYLGPDYGDLQRPAGEVAVADLPRLAHESFPLCMLNMFEGLKRDHHLKHTGRQQLGNFLKGIGLSLDSAIAFWRTEFAKGGMPEDKFKKEHLYNIRHSFGKEGKRVNYTPASCMSVINSAPGQGIVHGCPYKAFDADSVRAALARLRIEPDKVRAAVGKMQGGHYQLACAAAWEGAHGCECVTGINHPNQYYTESRKVHDAQMGVTEETKDADASLNPAALPKLLDEPVLAVTPSRQTS